MWLITRHTYGNRKSHARKLWICRSKKYWMRLQDALSSHSLWADNHERWSKVSNLGRSECHNTWSIKSNSSNKNNVNNSTKYSLNANSSLKHASIARKYSSKPNYRLNPSQIAGRILTIKKPSKNSKNSRISAAAKKTTSNQPNMQNTASNLRSAVKAPR